MRKRLTVASVARGQRLLMLFLLTQLSGSFLRVLTGAALVR